VNDDGTTSEDLFSNNPTVGCRISRVSRGTSYIYSNVKGISN
jgi:hypothetical protein